MAAHARTLTLALAFALALTAGARAADDATALREQWQDAFYKADYARAAQVLERLTRAPGATPVDWYNLACVRCRLGQAGPAEEALKGAVARGFVDFAQLLSDPDLACVKDSDTFEAVRQGWRELQDAVLQGKLDDLSQQRKGYAIERDEALRVVFASGHSAKALAESRELARQMAALWRAWVLPEGEGHRVAVSEGDRPDAWVLIWLPSPAEYDAWARRELGPGSERVGGVYQHQQQQLVARDVGATLRHEFWHVLHHRDMARAPGAQGPRSSWPLWAQEGLCSLPEDVEFAPEKDGAGMVRTLDERAALSKPLPSWRTNTARRMLRAGNLPRLADLVAQSDRGFMGSGSLGRYAAARALMMYLHEQGRLRAWYEAMHSTRAADATGARALEQATGKSLAQLDKDWRNWLTGVPDAPEARLSGPRLPVELDMRGGEGLVVREADARTMLRYGIVVGDIVVAVNHTPVRDQEDLARALSGRKKGDMVRVLLRSVPSAKGLPAREREVMVPVEE